VPIAAKALGAFAGLPDPPHMTTAWACQSGPGSVTFAASGAADTLATFSTAGTYVLRLAADGDANGDGAVDGLDFLYWQNEYGHWSAPMRNISTLILAAFFACTLAACTPKGQWHVTPDGTPGGSGTMKSPWDIQTALAHPAAVKPGHTIWLHGGTYGAGQKGLVSHLRGTKEAPIIVRQAPGERAIIDGHNVVKTPTLTVGGGWTWYWGFEVANTRYNTQGGGGLYMGNSPAPMDATGVRLINLIVHDATDAGVGIWVNSVDSEMYGCLVYYNGVAYNLSHGLYMQNRDGTRHVEDNIIFRNKSYGIHAYGSERAHLEGFHIEGNILFESGALRDTPGPNFIIGGECRADRIVFQDNYTWHCRGEGTDGFLGYAGRVVNGSVSALRNVLVGGEPVLRLYQWESATFRENRLVGQGNRLLWLDTAKDPKDWSVDLNRYYSSGTPVPFRENRKDLDLAMWRRLTGFDANSTLGQVPKDNWIYLRPNKYEPHRANLVIYNWLDRDTVAVDLSSVLKAGQAFELRDVQDYFGPPALKGKYAGGTVDIPMTGTAVAQPIVPADHAITHTPRQFGAFVLLPVKQP
jgi:hypothetical protein